MDTPLRMRPRRIGTFSQWLHRTKQLVPASYKHASLTLRRACSDVLLIELSGTWHRHSPR
jgi:hypothetical protein